MIELGDVCERLTDSEEIRTILRITTDERASEDCFWFFHRTSLLFVFLHEFGHHILGHIKFEYQDEFFNEIIDRSAGDLRAQARELHADEFAVYFVLSNLIMGILRDESLSLLGREPSDEASADELLLTAVIVSIGAFYLTRRIAFSTKTIVDELTHPLPPARLNHAMQTSRGWCKQHRPSLSGLVQLDLFQRVMTAIVRSTGDKASRQWSGQTLFLQSPAGHSYTEDLEGELRKLRAEHGRSDLLILT